MRKVLFLLLFALPIFLFGQFHSWDGQSIAPNAKIRCLNVFVNIIYDVHPDTNNIFNNPHLYWPTITDPNLEGINTAAIPTYLLDWMDTVYNPGQLHGTCTRLYGESSFDSLQITGDFVVVNLKESTVLSHGDFDSKTIRDVAIDMLEQSSAFTLFGHYGLSDFYARSVLIRNITKSYGGLNPGSGSGGRFTLQCVGDGDFYANPTNIVTHEISHGLFGSNNFHTSGGNHRGSGCVMPFLNIQCGYGLMGAAGSGLVCCNGYERWRMHWKHPQSVDYISARNITNTQSVVSDISKESGNRNFILRDFITYGDVVRIKLPYKDSETSSNQYIWLENHQIGSNGKLDFLQYSNTYSCRPVGGAGIYAYYQIGRDVLEGTETEVWDAYHRDNLKIIPAEGYYDYELLPDTSNVNCVSYVPQPYTLRRSVSNPLCGGQDQEFHLFPDVNDTVLYTTREYESFRIVKGGQNIDSLPLLGDNRDAFSTYTKINMGTNPSTNNTKTFHSNNSKYHSIYEYIRGHFAQKNVQTTYLTGLSIEMTPIQGTGNILVNIRWDDYDITNDTRWTGKIALKETAILTAGKTITLAQNRTVAQPTRDPETGLFAGRTRWICENGSFFRQDSASVLRLTENSSVVFNAGSRYELSKGARLEIKTGCTLTVLQGAKVQLKGTVEVDSGGVLILYDTAKMGDLARLIVRPGGKLVVDGGTLTSACSGEMWQGIEVVGDRTKRQITQYQGKVVLCNGAVVENALCGIYTGLREDTVNYATAGGIIIADSAFFHLSGRPEDGRNNYGLYLNGCTGYKVEQDTFLRATYPTDPAKISTGIYVAASGITANSLYRNKFEKLTYGVYVAGTNGFGPTGLCMTCNRFSDGKYDIYVSDRANVAQEQGFPTKGADNWFSTVLTSSFYNLGLDTVTYLYGNSSAPVSPYRVKLRSKAFLNSCASTLCNNNGGGGSVYLAGFQSGMNAYTTALAGNDNLDNTDNNNSPNLPNSPTDYSPTLLAEMRQSLSETYYEAVRALMSDTVLDLSQLEQWHAAAQPIADPYSLTETRFMEGYAETFAGNAENAEMANYVEFHTMKMALRNNDDAVGANNYSPLRAEPLR